MRRFFITVTSLPTVYRIRTRLASHEKKKRDQPNGWSLFLGGRGCDSSTLPRRQSRQVALAVWTTAISPRRKRQRCNHPSRLRQAGYSLFRFAHKLAVFLLTILSGKAKRPVQKHEAFYLVGEGGFEPPKAKPADLQSVPFGHSGTLPNPTTTTIPQENTFVKRKIQVFSLFF